MTTTRMRLALVAMLTAALSLVGIATTTGATAADSEPNAPAPNSPAVQPPDVVLFLTDDQRAGTERAMPFTWRFFQEPGRGVWYPNTQIPTNLCCPSRAAILTGRYPTETNMWDNSGRFGGYAPLKAWEDRTLPVWLDEIGYRTGLFGKYINEFGQGKYADTYGTTPPGWDQFTVYEGPAGAGYYANVRGIGSGTYTTDSLGQATADFIAQTPEDEPLFAYYSPFAPHSSYQAGPYKGSASAQVQRLARLHGKYRNPSFNKVNPAQPEWMRNLAPIKLRQTNSIVRRQTDTLQGVDVNVRRIVESVAQHRDLDNTLFIFMGDNGWSWGDHRLRGKRNAHVLVNEVPMLVRYPTSMTVPRPGTDARLANNIDVTATILAAAGAPEKVDGRPLNSPQERSELPLMAAPTIGVRKNTISRPAYCGIRTQTHTFVEYETGERELYDLRTDPFQMRNLAGDPREADLEQQLANRSDDTGCDMVWLTWAVAPYLPTK